MSVLDDIRESAAGAHGSLDEARTLVKRASDEAGELEESASSHGWAGVASAMSSTQETLEAVAAAIESALEATSDGLAKLGEITDEMSSDEVARRLGEVGERFESARSAAGEAVSSLDDARTSAAQADAETLLQVIDDAEENLNTGRESLESAVKDAESERAEATGWGN